MLPIERDWDLADFTSSTVLNGVEILIHKDEGRAMVVWPWDIDNSKFVNPAIEVVKQMGFATITEMGNLHPYRVGDSTTDDCDYFIVESND